MKWFIRIVALILCVGLGVLGACSPETSPCGDCPNGQLCDVNKKKCVKPSTCVACQTSAECDNAELCVDGCCKSTGTVSESDSSEATVTDASVTSETPDSTEIVVSPESSEEASTCSTNTDCTDPSKPVCDSAQGLCVACSQKSDCVQGDCVQGKCVKAIDKCQGVTCPKGESCTPSTGKCAASCPTNPCSGGLCCNAKGQCVTCGTKLVCEACTEHSECGSKARCAGLGGGKKTCIPVCPNDKCPPYFSCLSLGATLGKLCVPDGECKAVDRCKGVTCSGSQKCCPGTGVCSLCCSDSECSAGLKCLQVGSVKQCSSDPKACKPACQTGEVCDTKTGKCQSHCSTTGCSDKSKLCDTSSGACVNKDCRSNWTCPTGTVCNSSTGQCGQETDCRKKASLCSGRSCCSQSTGKCVTDCRQCVGCSVSGQVCNQATGVCSVPVCNMKSPCTSRSQCCGGKCELSVSRLKLLCRCKRDSDCGAGYRCKRGFLNKYCEK